MEKTKSQVKVKSNFNISCGILGIIKFILGILILPAVWAVTINFSKQLSFLDKTTISFFVRGIISYLVMHLFIYEPAGFYKKGQRILEIIFHFFSPLVKVASYVLPIYSLVIFALYLVVSLWLKNIQITKFFVLLFSFTLSFHLVFSASLLRKKESDFLKANYIFGFSFLYILNISFAAFVFNIVFSDFSFVHFINESFVFVKTFYLSILNQLFLPKGS